LGYFSFHPWARLVVAVHWAPMKLVFDAVVNTLGEEPRRVTAVGGGDINDAWSVTLDGGSRVFVKSNSRAPVGMFEAEAAGLRYLTEAASSLIVPEVLGVGQKFLILEHLEAQAGDQAESLGRGLAQLHRSAAPCFGLGHDNFIGTLPQANAPLSSWVEFFRVHRIEAQLAMPGARRAYDRSQRAAFDRLICKLPELVGPEEPPARLHGDLWGGNWMTTARGPALFDPAVYGGHREVDLSMMRLFGGFSPRSFAAYEEAYPLVSGAEERVELYQLYPLLVHLNLFGGGYAESAFRIVQRYV
jgi:fructosamine-3-kinase